MIGSVVEDSVHQESWWTPKMAASRTVEGVRVNRTGRRTYSDEYKREVMDLCRRPRASVSGVALAHGLNANLVRKWLRQRPSTLLKPSRKPVPVLLPVTIDQTTADSPAIDAMTSRPQRGLATAGIEIAIHGARIQVRGVVEVEALRNVLRALEQR